MANRATISAGLLLYRRTGDALEVLLAHPGCPFWARRDAGAWSIPKGLVADGEEPLVAACREFEEETGLRPTGPFLSLGSVRQKAGKLIYAWARKWIGATGSVSRWHGRSSIQPRRHSLIGSQPSCHSPAHFQRATALAQAEDYGIIPEK
jgi:hypothetical protein